MNLRHVKHVASREIRDQLRDRRAVFVFIVVPLVLYPLLGMLLLQMGHFVREHPTRVLVLGVENLPKSPQFIDGNHIVSKIFRAPPSWDFTPDKEEIADPEKAVHRRQMRQLLVFDEREEHDVTVEFPPGFGDQVVAYQAAVRARTRAGQPPNDLPKVPAPIISYDSGNERSNTASTRLKQALKLWGEHVLLEAHGIKPEDQIPYSVVDDDRAAEGYEDTAVWGSVFPMLLVLWALTGAFHPAIDLCAGEKERGTLETLLTTPMARSEIVSGKMLAVALFSIGTVAMNLLSMGVTGHLILSQIPSFGPPPPMSILWLALALIPVSAMFSAICVPIATFARSVKEGHYYLMPVLLLILPLVGIAMTPATELNLGNSLIPVTGIILLLRKLIEGNYAESLPYVAPVILVSTAFTVVGARAAIDMFNREHVLFRGAERFKVGWWLKSLVRDRGRLPTLGNALACALLILGLRLVASSVVGLPADFADFAWQTTALQVLGIALPAVLMAWVLTSAPRETLRLGPFRWWAPPAAALLAILVQPLVRTLADIVQTLYPMSPELTKALEHLMAPLASGNPWLLILVIALLPAVCEELAFRGFILSGLLEGGHVWRAAFISSVLFGMSHAILQQSLVAAVVGLLLAWIALRSGSLYACMAFHVVHNSLAVLLPAMSEKYPQVAERLFEVTETELHFYNYVVVIATALAAGLIGWWHRATQTEPAAERVPIGEVAETASTY